MGIVIAVVEVHARNSQDEQCGYGHGNARGLGPVAVDEVHVEHPDYGKQVLEPVLVVAVVARSHGGDDGRKQYGQQSCAQRQEEAQAEEFSGFAHHHEGGGYQRPLAYLQRQEAHHGLVRIRTGTHIDKAPEVGHLADDHDKAVDEAGLLLVFPVSQFVLILPDQDYCHYCKDHRGKVCKRPLPEIPQLSVSEEPLAEIDDFPYLAVHYIPPCLTGKYSM